MEIGEKVYIGEYPQTSDGEKRKIEWDVVCVEDEKALILSHYVLDCKQYNEDYTDVAWEECSLRRWLNNDFFNSAFSSKEKETIILSRINNCDNNETEDHIFLMSSETEPDRTSINRLVGFNCIEGIPTEYAIEQGVFSNKTRHGYCWWWLRDKGSCNNTAQAFMDNGALLFLGYEVDDYGRCGIRPAMWIKQ